MRHDTTHYYLIAKALTGTPGEPGVGWDWDQTIAVAAREEIIPALHNRLSGPPEVSDFLEAIRELNGDRNRQLLRETETLAAILNQAGIEPVLLKGAAYLTTEVYADPASRLLQDIDLLVSPVRPRRRSRSSSRPGISHISRTRPLSSCITGRH